MIFYITELYYSTEKERMQEKNWENMFKIFLYNWLDK